MRLFVGFLKVIYLVGVLFLGPTVSAEDEYQSGLPQYAAGKWKEALRRWELAYDRLSTLAEVDPRIAASFIEIVASKSDSERYSLASEIYMWGFSKESNKYFAIVKKEISRIIPLLPQSDQKKWEKELKSKSGNLSRLIFRYWLERDPRPSTSINERLIEHWQKIVQARKLYQYNQSGIYDCDDRGTIYVKYGKPEKTKVGRFGSSSTCQQEFMIWLGTGYKNREVNYLDHTPDYEVWGYNSIGTRETSIFLFANRNGTGRFGLVDGIESLYPQKNYIYTAQASDESGSKQRFVGSGARRMPRDYLIYPIMYYSELRTFDRFFDYRYTRMKEIWESNQREDGLGRANEGMDPSYAQLLRHLESDNKYKDKFTPVRKYANSDKSDYEDFFGKIELESQFVRLLDKNHKSQLAVLTSCFPEFKNQ